MPKSDPDELSVPPLLQPIAAGCNPIHPPGKPWPVPGSPTFPHPPDALPARSTAKQPVASPTHLYDARQSIIADLTRAVADAAARVARAAAGQSVFSNDLDARNTFAILHQLRVLLPLLPAKPPSQATASPPPWYHAGTIPICPHCLQGPGSHWIDRCPDIFANGRPDNYDDLRALQQVGRVKPPPAIPPPPEPDRSWMKG